MITEEMRLARQELESLSTSIAEAEANLSVLQAIDSGRALELRNELAKDY